MRQKVPYGIFGFFCGMAFAVFVVAPILQFVTHKEVEPIPGIYFFSILLVLGIVGIFVGLRVDKFMNDESEPSLVRNEENFISKYLKFLTISDRRVEGKFVVYIFNWSRAVVITSGAFLSVFLLNKYLSNFFGDLISWVIMLLVLITNIPEGRDKARAISNKVIINSQGKKEFWYEMSK